MIAVIFLTLFFIMDANAQQQTIHLICQFSHTVDEDGKSSPTSGEKLITVSFSKNGKAIIKKEGLGVKFTGTISNEEIYGETEYEIARETLIINRYTGAFKIFWETIESNAHLIHYGTCVPVIKKKF